MGKPLISIGILFVWLSVFVHFGYCKRKPIIFNFGDSNSDTGGAALSGGMLPLPNGRTFFHRPSGRLCDGRLIIDFLCESLNTSYLSPYQESLKSDFTNGANFAIAGSCAVEGPRKYVPCYLKLQVSWFIQFQTRSLQLTSQGVKGLLGDEDFKNALYTIDIGQNDVHNSISYQKLEGVLPKIPTFVSAIKASMRTIYDLGGRNFWVHSSGPLGCLPEQLSKNKNNASNYDQYGCLHSHNEAAKEFNKQLSALCEELRSEMKNVTIVYVDIYSIKYDIIANSAKYGFENPLMACTGFGGPPYNFNETLADQKTGYNVCSEAEGSKRINWDGVHYTEAVNALVASKILSTKYSTPQINLDHFF